MKSVFAVLLGSIALHAAQAAPLAPTPSVLAGAAGERAARGGIETQNGGSIVVNGETIELADLHFQAIDSERFEFDPILRGELKAIDALISKNLKVDWSLEVSDRYGYSSRMPFFSSQVFDPTVEYRFVERLPDGCRFIPEENLPGTPRTDIACTKGSITYILPQYFAKLDLLQQALLIIHERLHAFVPNEPYEVKTEIVRALHVLKGQWLPAFDRKDQSFRFKPKDLEVVNRLFTRFRQTLRGEYRVENKVPAFRFLSTGAMTVGDVRIQGERISILIGTTFRGSRIEGSDITVANSEISGDVIGRGIRVENSTLWKWVNGDEIALVSSSLQEVNGKRIRITGSVVSNETIGSDLSLERSKVKRVQGERIRLLDADVLGAEIKEAADIELERVSGLAHVTLSGMWISLRDVQLVPDQSRAPVMEWAGYGTSAFSCDSRIVIQGNRIQVENSALKVFAFDGGVNQGLIFCKQETGRRDKDDSVVPVRLVGSDLRVSGSTLTGVWVEGNSIQVTGRVLSTRIETEQTILGFTVISKEEIPVIRRQDDLGKLN